MNQDKSIATIKERLQDAVSLLMILENDLSSQQSDEIYFRTVRIIHEIVKSAQQELLNLNEEI